MKALCAPSALLALLAHAAAVCAGPAEDYVDAQLRVVRGLAEQVPGLVAAANEAAQRLLAGGKLYLAGERGMVSELHVRAGSLCATLLFVPGKTKLGAGDVVLFSDYGSRVGEMGPLWAATTAPGVLRIPFLPKGHDLLGRLAGTGVPTVSVDVPPGGQTLPAAAPAIATAQWAFVAELIGACRRQGKQLAVCLSIHLDEGRKRFERTKGLVFEPDLRPAAAPPGQFASEFLSQVRGALKAVRKDEAPKIRTAAAWLRKAAADRKKVVRHLTGHLPPTEAGPPGFFTHTLTGPTAEKGVEWIHKNLGPGDAYLLVGYQQNEDAMSDAANELAARTIFLTSRGPGAEQARSPLHLHVDPHWPLSDGCLDLPGYDVRACPLSGVMGITVYHAICAEAMSAK